MSAEDFNNDMKGHPTMSKFKCLTPGCGGKVMFVQRTYEDHTFEVVDGQIELLELNENVFDESYTPNIQCQGTCCKKFSTDDFLAAHKKVNQPTT